MKKRSFLSFLFILAILFWLNGAYARTVSIMAYNEFQDPTEFSKQMSLCYKSWSEENGEEDSSEADENLVERQSILEEAQESAWANISDYLSKLNPYDFQKLVAELLTGMEYHVHWISPPGKDGGLKL